MMSLLGLVGTYSALNLIGVLMALAAFMQIKDEYPNDPEDQKFIKEMASMFPEDFLSRYPHEAEVMSLKIFGYLIFNLLVKGYSSKGPDQVWSNYNRDDFSRTLIDAAFYEYLSNFTDNQNKDPLFSLAESERSSPPESTEEIAVDRIGQYLDSLSEIEPKSYKFKGAFDILPEREAADCAMQTIIQSPGKPGIDFPNFCRIPKTSFSCNGKRIPGIYADYQAGCQVFHACWSSRKDSFLCPIGTIFNQSLLTCDSWHVTSCYFSPKFHDHDQFLIDGISIERDVPEFDGSCHSLLTKPLRLNAKFLPFKCQSSDASGTKTTSNMCHEKDLQMRLEMAYDLSRDMLKMLSEIKIDLVNEMRSEGTPWIPVLNKKLEPKSEPKQNSKTTEETKEFTRKLGETNSNRIKASRKVSSERKPDPSISRSTLIEPSKSLNEYLISSKKQEVPRIVMESLKLGGNILNEGIIPLTKQVIIDSYRKIESKKH